MACGGGEGRGVGGCWTVPCLKSLAKVEKEREKEIIFHMMKKKSKS